MARPLDSLKHVKDAFKIAAAPLLGDTAKKTIKPKADTAKITLAAAAVNQPAARSADAIDSSKQAVVIMKKDSTLAVVMVSASDKPKQAAVAVKPWSYALSATKFDLKPVEAPAKAEPEPVDNNPALTSLIQLDSLREAATREEIEKENLRRLILHNEQIKLAEVLKINNLDSLKMQLKITTSDTVKALLYTRIAAKYMVYDTLASAENQLRRENTAINYTLLAIHEYSIYNDSTGLRNSYANLSKVYFSEKKYTEAKWFILQANTLSRAMRDTTNIISTLLSLAEIKTEIKDYTLAMTDLNEALELSVATHRARTEADILKSYALLYSNLQNYDKEAMALKKRDALLDSIRKAEEAEAAKAAALKKKQDLLAKKKQYLASLKKPSKTTPQKVASF